MPYELFEEAVAGGGAVRAGLGLLAGALACVAVDTALDRHVGGASPGQDREVAPQDGAEVSGGRCWRR